MEKRFQTWLLDLMANGSSPEGPRQKYHDLAVERFGSASADVGLFGLGQTLVH